MEGGDALARLGWGLRRYLVLVVLILAAFTAVGAAAAARQQPAAPTYRATALLVAAELGIRPEQLPRLASTVARSAGVAAAIARRAPVEVTAEEVLAGRVEVRPVEDTVLVRVDATADDPDAAAALADTAAEVLALALNRAGPGVGRFAVQQTALPPTAPEPEPPAALPLVLGVVAGAAFALGVVGLLLALRRPVLSGAEAAAVADAPLLGVVRLPRRGAVDPRQVPGATALAARAVPDGRGTVAVVGVGGDARAVRRVAELLVLTLERRGPVRYATADPDAAAALARRGAERVEVVGPEAVLLPSAVPVVVEGPADTGVDLPGALPGDARVVLVVAEGTPQAVVAAAAAQFLPGELSGVVFLGRSARSAGQRPAAGQAAQQREHAAGP